MGFTRKTPNGTWQAHWREPSGAQRCKTFPTKREANWFLAEVEASKSRDAYVSPHAGRVLFRDHAAKWMNTRRTEATTSARDASVMRTHVLPRWGSWQLRKIDHMEVQTWVTELGKCRSHWVVAKARQLTSNVMRSAVRSRLIGTNPCEDVTLPEQGQHDTGGGSSVASNRARSYCQSCCTATGRW